MKQETKNLDKLIMDKKELFAITNYILARGNNITNLKLQKLLFFFYGIHSCIYNDKPFESTIEAWKLGPVIPEVYFEFRNNGGCVIQNKANISEEEDVEEFPELKDNELIQSAKITLFYYDRFSANELVEESQKLDCWRKHYKDNKKEAMSYDEIRTEFDEKLMPNIVKYVENF